MSIKVMSFVWDGFPASGSEMLVMLALADSRGMEVSEYIRHLVLADREDARRQFDALNRIFGRERGADKGNQG